MIMSAISFIDNTKFSAVTAEERQQILKTQK